MNISEALKMTEMLLKEDIPTFEVGSFVFNTYRKSFGKIKSIEDGNYVVEHFKTKFGALDSGTETVPVKALRDGHTIIAKEIQTLERKIEDQRNIEAYIVDIEV